LAEIPWRGPPDLRQSLYIYEYNVGEEHQRHFRQANVTGAAGSLGDVSIDGRVSLLEFSMAVMLLIAFSVSAQFGIALYLRRLQHRDS
jgi:hypothetical protein